jgi:hypothetical protein
VTNGVLPVPYTWAAVGTAAKVSHGVYSIDDTAATADKYLVYRAILQTAEGQSAAQVTTLSAEAVEVGTSTTATGIELAKDDSSTTPPAANPSIYDTSTWGVRITINASTNGATYTVYRQAVDSNGDPTGAWEVVKVDTSTVESTAATAKAFTFKGGAGGGSASGTYTPTETRQLYKYRVEGVKDGLSPKLSDASSAAAAKAAGTLSTSTTYTAIPNAQAGTAAETGYYLLDSIGINTLRSGEKLVVYGRISGGSEEVLSEGAVYYATAAGTPAGAAAFPTTSGISLTTSGYYFLNARQADVAVTKVVIEKE